MGVHTFHVSLIFIALLPLKSKHMNSRHIQSDMMMSSNGNIGPRYWPFVRGIHRSPVNSPHKGQWRGTLMCSLICAWIDGWVNNREAGNLRHHRAHYDVMVIKMGGGRKHIFNHLRKNENIQMSIYLEIQWWPISIFVHIEGTWTVKFYHNCMIFMYMDFEIIRTLYTLVTWIEGICCIS